MNLYHYDRETGFFTGSVSKARESPLEPGVFLMPAFATDIDPPKTGPGQRAKFSKGKWVVKRVRETDKL